MGVNLWTQHEIPLDNLRQAIPGGPDGWCPNRMIFRDWWHWRDHELGFAHGRLALTGQNSGGKSSIMALAVPSLLDGDTSPIRLDPSLTRDRHLYWYLLGEDDLDPDQPDVFAYRSRIGYLALEFRHGTSGRFLTIGMGALADRNAPRRLKEWCGFVIEGPRLGRDFDLRDGGGNCVPPREFLRQQDPPGFRTIERGEYRKRVNATLFGMSDDDYQALISMLLQARRPRLGEQSGPEKVCDLLRASLPGIPGDRLDRVATVVQNIESYQRNLADVTARADAVCELDGRLRSLAEVIVQRAAGNWAVANGKAANYSRRLSDARAQLSEAECLLTDLDREMKEADDRRAALDTRLKVFLRQDDADLPVRMTDAIQEAARSEQDLRDRIRQVAEQKRGIDQHSRQLSALDVRFREDVRRFSSLVEGMSERAGEVVWPVAQQYLRRLFSRLNDLSVTAGTAVPSVLYPDPGLESEGKVLASSLRTVSDRLTAREQARRLYDRQRELMDELRRTSEELGRELAAAEDRAAAYREALVTSLGEWRDRSPAVDAPDHLLAGLCTTVRELEEPPAAGHAELTAPIRRHADDQRRQIERERWESMRRKARIELELQEADRRTVALERDGITPQRGQVRESARTDPSTAGQLPLFRWIRFRPGVDAGLMALVEAAAVEAGLLDLLLLSQPGAPADAWLVPEPLSGCPTLLEVLEPEPGAPDDVTRALASVGWGESSASRWIDSDGRWRNGLAQGQVMPWLTEPVGIVGAKRRRATIDAELARLIGIREDLETELATAVDQDRQLEQWLSSLETELGELDQLPWQQLFGALDRVSGLSERARAADIKIDQARPELEGNLRVFRDRESEYEQAVVECPAGRGLTAEGLLGRITIVERLTQELAGTPRGLDGLTAICSDYHERQELCARDQKILEGLGTRVRDAERDQEAAAARVRALEDRMRDPTVAALREEIERLTRERTEAERWREAAAIRRGELLSQREGASARIETLDPEEESARADAVSRLAELKRTLSLHSSLADCVHALEREGPVTAQRRLPRPADPERIEQEMDLLRASVQEFVQRHRDLLGDYRPTPSTAWETITFTLDRSPVTAGELFSALSALQEQCRGYIADGERELYQRIIYQGILDDLRRLIRHAREFTRRTNDRLRALKLSSGEVLSLWLSPGDPGHGGTRIGRALESMDQGSDWLADEQRDVILGLIQTEVERSRREAQAQDREFSYQEAIALTLDYRNWYQYQIRSTLPGRQSPVPIRKHGFGKRSTSARAWALAVPIIAGVAARYDAATMDDAPRMIALDEAFAGFDYNNQMNYLDFICGLNLNWIITCPDELPYGTTLTAAMAYRMELDGMVHVAFPILWDGTRAREPLGESLDEAAAGSDWAGGEQDV